MVQYALVVILALVSAWPSSLAAQAGEKGQSMGTAITIRIGETVFAATLADNATAIAFKKLLPLSITMTELNGNEKFAALSGTVPAHASVPVSIRTGDLMLYDSNTLVLFYKSFPTIYSYTKIGKVDDPAGLEAALGSDNVVVTFEAKWQKEKSGNVTRSRWIADARKTIRARSAPPKLRLPKAPVCYSRQGSGIGIDSKHSRTEADRVRVRAKLNPRPAVQGGRGRSPLGTERR